MRVKHPVHLTIISFLFVLFNLFVWVVAYPIHKDVIVSYVIGCVMLLGMGLAAIEG